MTDLRDAARQALEALQNCANGEDDVLLTRDALAALRAALEHAVSDERFAALVAAAERERACRIVTGLCISDNNAREINEAIRAKAQA